MKAVFKKASWFLLLFFCTSFFASAGKVYDFNATCQQAYKEITSLRLANGQKLAALARQQNPDNLIPDMLDSYVDFFILFFNEDPAELKARKPSFESHLNRLAEGPSSRRSRPFHGPCRRVRRRPAGLRSTGRSPITKPGRQAATPRMATRRPRAMVLRSDSVWISAHGQFLPLVMGSGLTSPPAMLDQLLLAAPSPRRAIDALSSVAPATSLLPVERTSRCVSGSKICSVLPRVRAIFWKSRRPGWALPPMQSWS